MIRHAGPGDDTAAPSAPGVALNSDTDNSGVGGTGTGGDGITNDNQVNVTDGWKPAHRGNTASMQTGLDGRHRQQNLPDDTAFAVGDVQARQTDVAGNTSVVGSNAGLDRGLDRSGGITSIALNSDTGTPGDNFITSDNVVNVTGLEAGAEDGNTVTYDGGTSWTNGTGTSFNMTSDTTYAAGDVQVRQTDVAGNLGPVGSNANTWVEDRCRAFGSIHECSLRLRPDGRWRTNGPSYTIDRSTMRGPDGTNGTITINGDFSGTKMTTCDVTQAD